MPYATNRDRDVSTLELTKAPWPAPPLNVFLTSGFEPGVFDLSWDDPTILAINGDFTVLGVNVYRSFDSAFGPFQRVSELLVGANFWRDRTDNELVTEDVSNQFVLRGETSATGSDTPRYVFKTLHYPIVKEGSQEVPADSPQDVRVFIDGVEARIQRVYGATGEVEIDALIYADVAKQKLDPSLVPGPDSQVICQYRRTRSLLKTDLAQRIFYRVTTVGIPTKGAPDLVETPLERAAAVHSYEVEKLDYIWREAVRRNRWILEQGGERVKAFLRKNAGVLCPCIPDDYHQQPVNDCPVCFGTRFVGGYEGPYDVLLAPDDAERRITQKDIGRTVEHTYEVWTGPVPLFSQRDFLVKINGDRYSIGPVRFPTNRGVTLQQHYNINHLDEKDIRYRVPMGNPVKYVATQFAPSGPEQEAEATPTDKPNIPEERQLKGRSKVWENITY